jgi:hypothetical protein
MGYPKANIEELENNNRIKITADCIGASMTIRMLPA